MAKFSDINRAAELNAAYTKYKAWQAKTRAQKNTAFDLVNKPDADRVNIDRVPAYILPFASDATVIRYEAQVLPATPTGIGAATASIVRNLINDRFTDELTVTEEGIRIKGYKFARVLASERTVTATTKDNSRFTDTPYKRHRSNNISCPFGRTTGGVTETFNEAVADIKNDGPFQTFAAIKGNRIGVLPEGG